MKHRLFRGAFLLFLAAGVAGGLRAGISHTVAGQQEDPKLPNGKSQRDEILKAEREENIRDAAKLVEMAGVEGRPGKERPLRALHGHPQENG
jgi:Na+-translocating ferredoxin:NAD+ oxidoreductase RnfG subunit